ncbi:MAG: aminoacyl-tRNA hydrolase [Bryobacteraceae bacterium]|nr:aminoacyl-tRNA hydrolase [Bryobacteraceae bacterium]
MPPVFESALIVGLGNPGAEYERTFHNLGFLVVDRLAARHSIRVTRKESMALVGSGRIGESQVVLAKPQTYMNVSGQSVKSLLEKSSIPPERLVLVYDELDLPWGSLRIRPNGSAAGHHGVMDVIRCVKTNEFARVRLGIHPGHALRDGAGYVLSKIGKAQEKELDELLDAAALAVESILAEGVEKAMTRCNRRAQGSNEKKEE